MRALQRAIAVVVRATSRSRYRLTRPALGTPQRGHGLARALADYFRAQGFGAQVFRTSGDRTVMQARKENLWRNLLGVA